MTNAQHSSAKQEHYTPSAIVEAARKVMGGIDLDPASCEKANEVVKAAAYCTRENNGLLHPWWGKVFLNPPGGREFPPDADHERSWGRPNSQLWWPKLVDEWCSGRVEQAIFVGFSIEILQSSQSGKGPIPLDFPFCIPRARTCFLDEQLVPQKDPTHANVIVYLPPAKHGGRARDVDFEASLDDEVFFKLAFSDFGRVTVPR